MRNFTSKLIRTSLDTRFRSSCRLVLFGLLLTCATGCSIFHPVRGVPASYLPVEFEGAQRSGKRTINPSLLVQTPPDQHLVAAGDVLSIYIPGVLGRMDAEVRQFGVEPPINQPFSPEDPPTIGYPIAVRDDNTIALPQVPPINVYNKTLHETELAIRKAYTEDFNILRPEEAMVLVSLQRPRVHRILVVRQETGNELASGGGGGVGTINVGVSKRGTARVVTLKAYENDVLHALATEEGVDGLPGLDAENTIYIIRRRARRIHRAADAPYPQQQEMQQMQGQRGDLSQNNRATTQYQSQQNEIQLASATQPQMTLPTRQSSVVTADYRTSGSAHAFRTRNIRQLGHTFPGAQVPQSPVQQIQGVQNYSAPGLQQPAYQPAAPYAGHSLPQSPRQPATPSQFAPGQLSPGPTLQGLQGPGPGPGPILPPPNTPYNSQPQSYGHQFPNQQLQSTPPLAPPILETNPSWSSLLQDFDPTVDSPDVLKIPIRLASGEQLNITEEMITLEDGDIVFIESRETDVIYTGGLLGGGQFTLPREYDLGVLEAISIAEGRSANGGGAARSVGGVSALNRDVSVSASRLIILRTLQTGQRITIEVNLHKAMKYQAENILVQPGDMLILEYTALESIAAITQRYLLEGALFSLAAAQLNTGN